MLIAFRVENFRSLGSLAELSMVASSLKAKDPAIDANNVITARGGDLRLLRSAAIYGPNASGKSNLVKALDFMRTMVLDSSHKMQAGDTIDVVPYCLRGKWDPSRFEIEFLLDDRQYRYGFEASRRKITEEWLYVKQTSREKTYFERTGQTITLGTEFRKEGQGLDERTRDNALFLSVVAQFNGKLAGRVRAWFVDLFVMSGLDDQDAWTHTEQQLADDAGRKAVVGWVKTFDLGIDDVDIREEPSAGGTAARKYRIDTRHRQLGEQGEVRGTASFDLFRDESEGTQKLFALTGPILDALRRGRLMVIDEFDARLHPLLSRKLVQVFQDPDLNAHGAQLVFATHDTNLLDATLLRRDQIWFVEKDRFGASHLYSLAEFNVRNDAALEKNYIEGKYGAIPFFGDLRRLPGDDVDG